MSLTDNKKIQIYGHNVDASYRTGIENLTGLVNTLLEKYFAAEIVTLEKDNKEYLENISEECNRTVNEIVNSVLKTIEIVPPKVEKIQVELDDKAVKVKKKRITAIISG